MLHDLGEPGIRPRQLLLRQANVHIVMITLPRRFRCRRFGLRNHRFCGGLLLSRSRDGRRRGHPDDLAPGMLIETAGGLSLLLLGGLAVALTMNAFRCLILLPLGAVPLLHTLLATQQTLVVVVPTGPCCFHISGLGTLACVVLVSSTERPGVKPLSRCRREASLASITAWSRRCSAIGLSCASGSCTMRSIRIYLTFHLASEHEWLAYR